MKFIPRFGKPAYVAPQVSTVPEGQGADQNGTYVNAEKRQLLIKICDGGKPEDLAFALGTLEIAKDIVKSTLTLWHQADARRKGILVPRGN